MSDSPIAGNGPVGGASAIQVGGGRDHVHPVRRRGGWGHVHPVRRRGEASVAPCGKPLELSLSLRGIAAGFIRLVGVGRVRHENTEGDRAWVSHVSFYIQDSTRPKKTLPPVQLNRPKY